MTTRRAAAALAIGIVAGACQAGSPTLPPIPFIPVTPPDATLEVRTLTPGGAAPGARVCATSPLGVERCGTADRAGEVALKVPPGAYVVRATPAEGARLAPGFTSVAVEGRGAAVPILLSGLAKLSGTVRDPEGKPVAGAEACGHPAGDEPVVCARTNAQGRFTVEGRPAIYRFEVSGPRDGSRLIAQWARGRVASFEADAFDARAADVEGIEVTLVRGLVLSGTVTGAPDGRAIEDAQVCTQTLAAPLPWDCERTDEDGRYVLLREPGRYWVWTIPPDDSRSRLITQRYDRADVGVNATPFVIDRDRTLDIALREGTVVSGRVTMDGGALVPFALVCIDTPFTTGRICREADGNARYAIATRPETYTLQIIPPADSEAVGEYWSRKRTWVDADAIVVGTSDVDRDIVLRRGARLSGYVRTEDGVPVESAPVSVNDDGGFIVGTYTDHRGHYALSVPEGELTIDVFAPRVSQLVSRVGLRISAEAGRDIGLDAVLPFARP
ncbi:MAG TPA: carboxypeptidase-like regulatory domain-containing protein [Candidatus Limnocylindria bacterium]|nr:carboxypeptidase-like regulatory domain-containing protein [Candidatus Limnocylindria bacterium]